MQNIDKENFIKDIKKDLGIKERNYEENYKLETFEELDNLDKIFENFFGKNASSKSKNDFNNPNNIMINYNIDERNTKTEHKKIFKYKRNNNGVIEKRKIEITIPAHIKNGQILLVRGEGNKELELLGHLMIKINVKHHFKEK